jgi:CRISPR system Cascade subunit CasA
MNLVIDPWIPVVTTDGTPKDINLMQVFTEGEKYADLAVRPHERVALMRLLICIAQAALDGPKDKDDWKEVPKKLSEEAKKYLDKWNKEEVFELFHKEKPFLQVADLESDVLTPLNYMEFALSHSGNPAMHNYFTEDKSIRSFTDKQIALMLPTFLCFSTGGGLPITTWGTKRTHQVGSDNRDALCITGSMFHLFIRGQNIVETISDNLLPQATVKRHWGQRVGNDFWGKPVWEYFPSNTTDDNAIANATTTYLGRLMPLCRWIKIEKENNGMHCGNGFVYPVMERKILKTRKNQLPNPPWPAEPTASVVLRKNERILLGVRPIEADKAVWRELAAIMVCRNENSLGGPLSLENPIYKNKFDIMICALHRKSGQQAIENMFESVYSVSSKLMDERGRNIYQEGIEEAEWRSYSLGNAIDTYRKNLDGYWEQRKRISKSPAALKAQLHSKATRSYWTTIEKQRHLLMAYIDVFDVDDKYEAAQKAWHDAIHKAAREAYITACGQETPRQIRAFALGWKKLFTEKKNDTENEEQQNNDGGEE